MFGVKISVEATNSNLNLLPERPSPTTYGGLVPKYSECRSVWCRFLSPAGICKEEENLYLEVGSLEDAHPAITHVITPLTLLSDIKEPIIPHITMRSVTIP